MWGTMRNITTGAQGTLTWRPGRQIAPDYTIDAGSSLTHGAAVAGRLLTNVPSFPMRPAILISLLPGRPS